MRGPAPIIQGRQREHRAGDLAMAASQAPEFSLEQVITKALLHGRLASCLARCSL